MPVVCNFTQIIGDSPITIGDMRQVWEQNFSTPGRQSNHPAFLIFNIRGLTYATEKVSVRVNNVVVGSLVPYAAANDAARDMLGGHWFTQMVALTGSQLNDGQNELQINAIGYPGSSADNAFDDFMVKNVSCFYHILV